MEPTATTLQIPSNDSKNCSTQCFFIKYLNETKNAHHGDKQVQGITSKYMRFDYPNKPYFWQCKILRTGHGQPSPAGQSQSADSGARRSDIMVMARAAARSRAEQQSKRRVSMHSTSRRQSRYLDGNLTPLSRDSGDKIRKHPAGPVPSRPRGPEGRQTADQSL